MLSRVLAYFPPNTHSITLVHDPDAVLADERIRSALRERGFQFIEESDPITLRYRVQRSQPFTPERPAVISTAGPLNTLPYDLWQQGHQVDLAAPQTLP